MHNDFGSKQPVQSHEPNIISWINAYLYPPEAIHQRNKVCCITVITV